MILTMFITNILMSTKPIIIIIIIISVIIVILRSVSAPLAAVWARLAPSHEFESHSSPPKWWRSRTSDSYGQSQW